MEGWVKIHRQLKDHWLWKSERRLKWWLDILFTVNHADSKILIKGQLIECKRGQSIRSLESWAREWNITKGAVRDFFKLLESDQMLYTESLNITTRITVCKYDEYQAELHAEKTHRKRKTNGEETVGIPKQEGEEEIKNEDNGKEEEVFNFKKSLIGLGVDENVVSDWLKVRQKKKGANTETAFLEIKKQIELSGATANDCIKQAVIKNWCGFESDWYNNSKITNNGHNKQFTGRQQKDVNKLWDQEN